jgi:hypothetical protein
MKHPKILSISGEGRNVGKTMLACSIIAKFSRTYDITGLKITPHHHTDTGEAKIIMEKNNFILLEETDFRSPKDTGRMLAAGAIRSFLLQIRDEDWTEPLNSFFTFLNQDALIVCESGKLTSSKWSGVNLFVRQLNCQVCSIDKKIPDWKYIDRLVNYTLNGFDLNLNDISIQKGVWKIK